MITTEKEQLVTYVGLAAKELLDNITHQLLFVNINLQVQCHYNTSLIQQYYENYTKIQDPL